LTATDSDAMQSLVKVGIVVGANLYLEPDLRLIQVGQNTTFDLMVDGVRNLYGFQLELAFNPTVMEVVDAYPGIPGIQIEEGTFFIPENLVINQADNTAGTIKYSASLQGAKPGLTGGGRLARLTFHSKAPGVSTVDFTRTILSDPFSVEIPSGRQGGQVSIQQLAGSLSGKVTLERRPSSTGAQVCLDQVCANTNPNGNYTFPLLPIGNYTAIVTHPGYLSSWHTFNLQTGPFTLPDVTLLGGDINPDGHIELADAQLIGQAWNATPSTPNWFEAADITNDSQINVLDMVAVQYNWDISAPGPWINEEQPQAVAPQIAMPQRDTPTPSDIVTQVLVSPPTSDIPTLGTTFDVDILVQDISDLYAYRLQISYDPTVVRVRDADPRSSAPGVQIQPGTFLDLMNQYVIVNKADNVTGKIDFAVTQIYPAVAKSGSGLLARITFEGLKPGSSLVDVFQARMLDDSVPDPIEIPVAITDGNILVGSMYTHTMRLPVVIR
jgi:hypothetical protein